MSPFAEAVEQWHDFYILVGTAAATLVGLLFVGLSINIELLRRDEYGDVRALASQTFVSFVYVISFSVLFLIPRQSANGLGIPLFILGLTGLVNIFGHVRQARSSPSHFFSRRIIPRFALPIVAFIALVVVSISVLAGATDGLYWLVAVMLILLTNASSNAWDLLMRMPERNPAPNPKP